VNVLSALLLVLSNICEWGDLWQLEVKLLWSVTSAFGNVIGRSFWCEQLSLFWAGFCWKKLFTIIGCNQQIVKLWNWCISLLCLFRPMLQLLLKSSRLGEIFAWAVFFKWSLIWDTIVLYCITGKDIYEVYKMLVRFDYEFVFISLFFPMISFLLR